MTKTAIASEQRSVDWTKPIEVKFAWGVWVPAVVRYFDDKGALVDYARPDSTVGDYPFRLVSKLPSGLVRNVKESRAVKSNNRLDLTKPLKGFIKSTGRFFDGVTLMGGIDNASQNFPSWFVCKWNTKGFDENEEYFLMRGDGKTDIADIVIRNVKK